MKRVSVQLPEEYIARLKSMPGRFSEHIRQALVEYFATRSPDDETRDLPDPPVES